MLPENKYPFCYNNIVMIFWEKLHNTQEKLKYNLNTLHLSYVYHKWALPMVRISQPLRYTISQRFVGTKYHIPDCTHKTDSITP